MELKVRNHWLPYITFYTTNQFKSIKPGYKRHCGPTAITNLLLTLRNRNPHLLKDLSTEDVFKKVAKIGKKSLIFWNADFGLIGGTSDILIPIYINICFRKLGLNKPMIKPRYRFNAKRVINGLNNGAIMYLEFRKHPYYGNHHVILFGMHPKSTINNPLFLIADGWHIEPVVLPLNNVKKAYLYEIKPNN